MKKGNRLGWWAVLLVLGFPLALRAAERQHTLILGAVENNPKKEAAVLQPMVDYAASKMGDVGIVQGEIFIAQSREELVDALKTGHVDWVTDTPFPVILMMEQTGAEIMLRRWKNGVSAYASLFFVHKDSDIRSLEDLRGRRVAFGDLDSTTTYFVPLAVLREKGLTATAIASPRATAPSDKVAYIFAQDQANIFNWVQRKLVSAGVASTSDWEEAQDMTAQFRILHQTKPFPRSVELVRKELAPRIKARLKEVLLAAEDDAQAQDALKAYKKTKKFDEMDDDAMAGLANAREILKQIRDILH